MSQQARNWTWLVDGQEIRSPMCQMRDSAPSTDEITKTLIVSGGEDTIDMVVFLIQALWETEHKHMGSGACGHRGLHVVQSQKQPSTKSKVHHAHRLEQTLSLSKNSMGQIETLRPGLVLTLCIFNPAKAKFDPENDPFTFIFADIARAHPSVPPPELIKPRTKHSTCSSLF